MIPTSTSASSTEIGNSTFATCCPVSGSPSVSPDDPSRIDTKKSRAETAATPMINRFGMQTTVPMAAAALNRLRVE